MRERSELARKGIARGRSVVALAYSGGVLFVAENPSRSLQKVSELYDRVGFAAVGRFNEFDNLRRGGIQFADTRGYAYDRRDVTGRQLANVYAQTLGTIFTEQAKPYEVELCVAEVAHFGETKSPELYRITYDGSIADEPHFVVMGGTTEPIITALNDSYTENAGLSEAARIAIDALKALGVKLALVTNGAAETQRAKVERFELTHRFDHIQIEGEHGFGKPEERAYLHAMEALGVTAPETWMIGDNLEWEVEAPQRLGIYAIWIDVHGDGLPAESAIKPDRIIRSLTELLPTE